MAITRVQTVGVYVSDQQAALDFYKNKLGFEVRQDMPMGGPDGPRWIEVLPPGSETGIVLSTPEGMGGHADRIGTFTNIIMTADDVQKTYDQLSGRGVRFTEQRVVRFAEYRTRPIEQAVELGIELHVHVWTLTCGSRPG